MIAKRRVKTDKVASVKGDGSQGRPEGDRCHTDT
jgi:hypothetical protein